jgi:cytochrome c oxidase cbb3-type subunit 3
MRSYLPKLLMISLVACAAYAQAEPGDVKSPGPEQLMGVHVGQTEIPYNAEGEQLQNPYENDTGAVAQGKMLFNAMNCVGCHAPLGGGGMGPPLSDNAWIYGSEPGQVYLSILQGRPNGMPAFAKALPPNAIWQLVSYVRSLSTDSPGKPVEELPKAKQTGR